MIGQPVRTLRRWGLSWWAIFKCAIGLHHLYVRDRGLTCGRCGKEVE